MIFTKINTSKIFLFTTTILRLGFLYEHEALAQSAVTSQPSATVSARGHRDQDDRSLPMEDPSKPTKEVQDSGTAAPDTSSNTTDRARTKLHSAELDPITVTGSHIRGAAPAGAALDVYDKQTIDRSGYATVHDFLQTLPQNFQGGGGSEDAFAGPLLSSNAFNGTTVNLRGLGADATLVLINGRRLPSSGLEGDFVDISNIPQAAVERVEVLSDGASALYGSDAVGGVVNIILRKDFEGFETRARYGTVTKGNLDEYRAAQAFGTNWETGNFIISYEFYKRGNLLNKYRSYAATSDLRRFGGTDYRSNLGNPGNILDPMTGQPAFAIPKNQDGRNLTVEDLLPGQINYGDNLSNVDILPKQKRHSLFSALELRVLENLDLFAELRYSERKNDNIVTAPGTTLIVPSTNPFYINPFGDAPLMIAYSLEPELGQMTGHGRLRTGSATAGVRLALASWRWETYINYGQEKSRFISFSPNFAALFEALADPNPETAFNPFGDGKVNNQNTIAKLWSKYAEKPNSKITTINSKLDGPVFSVNGHQVFAAIGADYRSESFSSTFSENGELSSESSLSRKVYSIFGELFVPLVAPEVDTPLVYSLDLSLAGRYEKYDEEGSTTNPKIGMRWRPIRHFSLNATYGTSFRAPHLRERVITGNYSMITRLPDPSSATGQTATLVLFGNDPEMTHETAETWTAGITLEPTLIPGLSGRITYFKTVFKDRIVQPDSLATVLFNEEEYQSLIQRFPSSTILNDLCADSNFLGNPAECVPSIVGAILDFRKKNIAKNIVRGLDFSVDFSTNSSFGHLSLGASATYLIDHIRQSTDTAPRFDAVDRLGQPVDFRARAYLSNSWNALTATVTLNYTDSYRNDVSNRQDKIRSYTTMDFNLLININDILSKQKLPAMSLSLSALNVFANNPPFADNPLGIGYDPNNVDPLGRFIAAEIRISW